jgi:hypothetical protein
MNATIEELGTVVRPLWKGEALQANWNGDKGEFLLSADSIDQIQDVIMKCVKDRIKLAIGIEDMGSTQVVWRGYVDRVDFNESGSEKTECALAMFVDDWWGIFPGFSSFYFS